MAEELIAKVRVIPPPGQENQVASPAPKNLSDQDLDRIASVVNRSVSALQQQLQAIAQPQGPGQLSLSEVQLKFGVDLEGEAKIPIIGPLLQIGYKTGATFEVQIKLQKLPGQ
jgi:hypothetical protein